MTLLKHKSAYINSFKDAIVGGELNVSYPNVASSSPYYAELNEEQEVSSFAYELGKVVRENVSSGGNSGEGDNNTNTNYDDRYAKIDHNHDNIYAKIVHNHNDIYYTKDEENSWRNELINGNLLFNKINANHIQAGTIIAGSSIIANEAIGSSHISSLTADKIDAGVIDTSKITISGANGNLKLKGNRLQVFQGFGNDQVERVSLGDVDNDGTIYGLRVRGADGNTILYDENGVYSEGITDGSITNDKISDDANIDGYKLNIHSIITNINENNVGTIHGTKIDIDGEGLSSKIYDIILNQNEHSETIKRQEAQIKQNSDEISLKVSSQEYQEDMSSMTSKLNKAESDIEILNEGIKLSASKTEVQNQINEVKDFVSGEIGDISIGGANYINNSAPRKATVIELPKWDTTLNGKYSLTYWQDYNDEVENPNIGYHPHIDLDTFHFPCIALINRNATYGLANRELSLKQEIYNHEEFIEEEENYVLSFDAYSDTGNFTFYGGLHHTVLESDEYNYHSGMMSITIPSEHVGTWQRYSYSFTTRVGIDKSNPMYLIISTHNNLEGSGYIKNIKLEKSNIVSQWTPSQFDVDDSLDDVVNSMKDYTNDSIKNYNSSIDVKFDSITSRVDYTENGVDNLNSKYTEIKQTIDSIDLTGVVKFNDLSTSGATTIHGANIKSNTLSINSISSNNAHPIIKLFPHTDSYGDTAYCSIDATQLYEQGQGEAIRLKWDSMNYILQKRLGVDLYCEPREQGSAFAFRSDYGEHTSQYESRIYTKDGTLCFRRGSGGDLSSASLYFYTGSGNYDRKLLTNYDLSNSYSSTSTTHVATPYAVKQAYDRANSAYSLANHSHPYASSSHTHSGYASSSHTHSNYLTTSNTTYFKTGSHDPYSTDKYNLGYSSYRWNQCAAKYVYATNTYSLAIDNPVAVINDDSLDNVLDDVIITSPNVVRTSIDEAMNNRLMFNVNALSQNENGHLFVSEDDGGNKVVSESSLLALAIMEIQKLKNQVKELNSKINELLEKGDN